MVRAYSTVAVLYAALIFASNNTMEARTPAPARPATTALGRFSFAAPKGWLLEPRTDREYTYWLKPAGRSKPRCAISLRVESAGTPLDAQSLQTVRLRSGLGDAREDEIRRSELRSAKGLRISKADLRFGYSFPALRTALLMRMILYSFRGPDGRVYTLSCSPEGGHGPEFEKPLDDLARRISF